MTGHPFGLGPSGLMWNSYFNHLAAHRWKRQRTFGIAGSHLAALDEKLCNVVFCRTVRKVLHKEPAFCKHLTISPLAERASIEAPALALQVTGRSGDRLACDRNRNHCNKRCGADGIAQRLCDDGWWCIESDSLRLVPLQARSSGSGPPPQHDSIRAQRLNCGV